MTRPIEVLINESDEIFRLGLEHALAGSTQFLTVGTGRNENECLTLLERLRPDILLTDDKFALGWNELIDKIRSTSPTTGTILIKSPFPRSDMWKARQAGVDACAPRNLTRDELLKLVSAVHRRDRNLITKSQNKKARLVLAETREPTRPASLTPRERCILELVSHGDTNRKIAQQLAISEKTVKNHMTNILCKLNTTDRFSAAEIAGQEIG